MQDLLKIEHWGLTADDLDKKFKIGEHQKKYYGGILATKEEWTLREVREVMQKAYCGKIGLEFMYLTNREQKNWMKDRMELF